jgi:hypothetical protein
MIVDLRRPQSLAGHCIHGMKVAAPIADIGRPSRRSRSKRNGRAHQGASVELPVGAAGARIERIDFSSLAADEHPPADDGRLREGESCTGESERPLELKAGHVRRRELSHLRRLKAALRRINAPPVPMGSTERISEGRGCIRASACGRRCRTGFLGRRLA